jgi:hypothetical protein
MEEKRKRPYEDLQPNTYLLISATPLMFTQWLFSTNHKNIETFTTTPRITRLIRSEKSSRNTKPRKVNNW